MRTRLLRCLLICVLLLLASRLQAETIQLLIKALDQKADLLVGIRFAFNGVESAPTTDTGVTTLTVPKKAPGAAIHLDLPRSVSLEWFLINPTVHVPAGPSEGPATLVLMLRSEMRKLADSSNVVIGQSGSGEDILRERAILVLRANEIGLSEEELLHAIEAFGKTEDEKDRRLAAKMAAVYGAKEIDLLITEPL